MKLRYQEVEGIYSLVIWRRCFNCKIKVQLTLSEPWRHARGGRGGKV